MGSEGKHCRVTLHGKTAVTIETMCAGAAALMLSFCRVKCHKFEDLQQIAVYDATRLEFPCSQCNYGNCCSFCFCSAPMVFDY